MELQESLDLATMVEATSRVECDTLVQELTSAKRANRTQRGQQSGANFHHTTPVLSSLLGSVLSRLMPSPSRHQPVSINQSAHALQGGETFRLSFHFQDEQHSEASNEPFSLSQHSRRTTEITREFFSPQFLGCWCYYF